ncbi:MAG: MarR family transcriptional regulator [Coriobacteriia bacterium]|nr:MarR family transcriptional regulator [Coriobacteriia bacterium]MBN2839399.1 MarR family transcriptional regulator [Coriobacteriia bacterium]
MDHAYPDLGQLVNHVARLFRQAMGREAAAFGLTALQAAVVLSVADSSVPVGTIAERLGTDRATMTGVAERLVRDGWAHLRPNPADGRSRLLELTPRAASALPGLASAATTISASAAGTLTNEEIAQLVSLLDVTARALEAVGDR